MTRLGENRAQKVECEGGRNENDEGARVLGLAGNGWPLFCGVCGESASKENRRNSFQLLLIASTQSLLNVLKSCLYG